MDDLVIDNEEVTVGIGAGEAGAGVRAARARAGEMTAQRRAREGDHLHGDGRARPEAVDELLGRDVTPPRLVRNISEVCTTESGQWFVGALERIVRSDDQGTTWYVEHELTGTGHRWVYALHVEPDGRGIAVGPHNTGYVRAV